MSVRKFDGSLSHADLSSSWALTVPEDHKFVNIIGAYSIDGKVEYEIDSVNISGDQLTVSFGIDDHSGVLKYSYESENSQVVTTASGGVININMTQNNSSPRT